MLKPLRLQIRRSFLAADATRAEDGHVLVLVVGQLVRNERRELSKGFRSRVDGSPERPYLHLIVISSVYYYGLCLVGASNEFIPFHGVEISRGFQVARIHVWDAQRNDFAFDSDSHSVKWLFVAPRVFDVAAFD